MFAVVKIGSSQYFVSPGQELLVDFQGPDAKKLVFDQVLLVVDGEKVTIGKPLVPNIVIQTEVVDHPKGDKIRVSKFKAKSRYRKSIGFRPHYTRLKIISVSAPGEKVTVESKPVTQPKIKKISKSAKSRESEN